jgi:hypothetical protein
MKEIIFPGPSKVAMALIYRILWSKLPRKSIVSGLWLREYEGTPLFPNCFLNVLPPAKYPYFRFYLKNYILVTPGEAGLWQQATEEERIQYSLSIEEKGKGKADWDVLKQLEVVLKEEYKKYFPSTRGIFLNYTYSMEEQKRILSVLNEKYILSLGK